MSKKSRARPGKHSRKTQATGNGQSEATNTVDHERITELLLRLIPLISPDKRDENLREFVGDIFMCIRLYQSELAWSRHQVEIRKGIDELGKMVSKQMMNIMRLQSIAEYLAWKERVRAQDGGNFGIITSLLPAMDSFLSVLADAYRQIKPKPGPYLAGRVLVASLITTIESYTGRRIGHSYKDDLPSLLKELVAAIDPGIRSGTIDETLRVRARGEKLLPVWGDLPLGSPRESDPKMMPLTIEQYMELRAAQRSYNHGEIDG